MKNWSDLRGSLNKKMTDWAFFSESGRSNEVVGLTGWWLGRVALYFKLRTEKDRLHNVIFSFMYAGALSYHWQQNYLLSSHVDNNTGVS